MAHELQTHQREEAVVISRGAVRPTDLLDLCRAIEDMHREARSTKGALTLTGPSGHSVALPDSVSSALEAILGRLVEEDEVSVVGTGKELSTQEAANLLNVSRQYFTRLLDEERIPSHNVGSHRRVYARDVLAFKAKRDATRRRKLNELTRLTEEFGGYDTERR